MSMLQTNCVKPKHFEDVGLNIDPIDARILLLKFGNEIVTEHLKRNQGTFPIKQFIDGHP